MENRVARIFGTKYPIVQGGMVWCSGWRLASAVSNAGGLGLIGAGSMSIDIFRENVAKCKAATSQSFGVNLPLNLQPDMNPYIQCIIDEKVPVVFTSAGSPKVWTKKLHEHGIKVAHVVPNMKLALKCQDAGVDAIAAEGFEAGGHNGREESTTMTLIPHIRHHLSPDIPLIAAGGIASGGAIMASMALGAEGVQIGTRFAITKESSCSEAFKQVCVKAKEGDTWLTFKQGMPTRVLLNQYGKDISAMSAAGKSVEELLDYRGHGRGRRGMLEGDLAEGELSIGQITSECNDIPSVAELMERLVAEFNACSGRISGMKM